MNLNKINMNKLHLNQTNAFVPVRRSSIVLQQDRYQRKEMLGVFGEGSTRLLRMQKSPPRAGDLPRTPQSNPLTNSSGGNMDPSPFSYQFSPMKPPKRYDSSVKNKKSSRNSKIIKRGSSKNLKTVYQQVDSQTQKQLSLYSQTLRDTNLNSTILSPSDIAPPELALKKQLIQQIKADFKAIKSQQLTKKRPSMFQIHSPENPTSAAKKWESQQMQSQDFSMLDFLAPSEDKEISDPRQNKIARKFMKTQSKLSQILDKDSILAPEPPKQHLEPPNEPRVQDYTKLIKRLHRRRYIAVSALGQGHMDKSMSRNKSIFSQQSIQMLEDNRASTELEVFSTKPSNVTGSTPFIAHSVVKRIVQAPSLRPVSQSNMRNIHERHSSMRQIISPQIWQGDRQRPMTSKNVVKRRNESASSKQYRFSKEPTENLSKVQKDRLMKLNYIRNVLKGDQSPEPQQLPITKKKSKKVVAQKVKVVQKPNAPIIRQNTEKIDKETRQSIDQRIKKSFTFVGDVENTRNNSLIEYSPAPTSKKEIKPQKARRIIPRLNLNSSKPKLQQQQLGIPREPDFLNPKIQKLFTFQKNKIMHKAFSDEKFKNQPASLLTTQVKRASKCHKASLRKSHLTKCSLDIKNQIKCEVDRIFRSYFTNNFDSLKSILEGKKLNILNEIDTRKLVKIRRLKEEKNRKRALKQRVRISAVHAAKMVARLGQIFKRKFPNIDKISEQCQRMLQKQAIKMKQMIYDCEKNIIVDSKTLHKNLFLTEEILTVTPKIKQCNSIHLIKGQPSYFVLKINLTDLLKNRSIVFPIKHRIIDERSIELEETIKKLLELKEKHVETKIMVLKNGIERAKEEIKQKMKEVKVYISTKCRLPNADNHEKMIHGLQNLIFYFGSQEILDKAKKMKQEMRRKVYFSFQYSEFDQQDIDQVQVKQEEDLSKSSVDFLLFIQFSQKLSSQQIQEKKRDIMRKKLDQHQSFFALTKKFNFRPLNQMNPYEQKQYLELQQTIITKDLKKFYVQNFQTEFTLDYQPAMKYLLQDNKIKHDCKKKQESESSDGHRRDDLSSSDCSSDFYVSSDHDDGAFDQFTGKEFIQENIKSVAIGQKFTLNQQRIFKKAFGAKMSDISEIAQFYKMEQEKKLFQKEELLENDSGYFTDQDYVCVDTNIKQIRLVNNQYRKAKIAQLMSKAQKMAKLRDNHREIKTQKALDHRVATLKDINRWNVYRDQRLKYQDICIAYVKKQAKLRIYLTFLKTQEIIRFILQILINHRKKRELSFTYISFASKLKRFFKRVYCKQYGQNEDIRYARNIQRSLTLYTVSSIDAMQQRAKDPVKWMLKNKVKEIHMENLVQCVVQTLKKLEDLINKIMAIKQTKKDRIICLRHLVFKQFAKMSKFYEKYIKKYKPKNKEQRKKYLKLQKAFKYFGIPYLAYEKTFIEEDLESESENDSSSSSGDQDSDSSSDSDNDQDSQLQRNIKEVQEIVLRNLKICIKVKSMHYTIQYMLYRFRLYTWCLCSGMQNHPKLGDLVKKKQLIQESIPIFKDQLEYLQDQIYFDTDQVLYDEYEKKAKKKVKMTKKQRRQEQLMKKQNALTNSKLYKKNTLLQRRITQTFTQDFEELQPVYEPFIFSISDEEINRIIYRSVFQYKERLQELKPKKIKKSKDLPLSDEDNN